MSSIFGRLSFDFDSSKFGEAEPLSNQSISYYETVGNQLKDWQYDDIVNSTASREQYFRNPISNVCLDIKVSANSLFEVSNGVYFTSNPSTGNLISSTASSLILEIDALRSHTDNVSGVSSSSMSTGIPSYDLMVAVGNEITRLLVNQEDIANTSGVLGSATSLFIEDDLTVYFSILENDVSLVNSSITIISTEDPENPGEFIDSLESNLSISQVTSVYNNVSSFYTFVNTRRTHDWQFFENSLNVLNDLSSVNRFTFVGNTQIYLINNYIGTEKLKNIIANT